MSIWYHREKVSSNNPPVTYIRVYPADIPRPLDLVLNHLGPTEVVTSSENFRDRIRLGDRSFFFTEPDAAEIYYREMRFLFNSEGKICPWAAPAEFLNHIHGRVIEAETPVGKHRLCYLPSLLVQDAKKLNASVPAILPLWIRVSDVLPARDEWVRVIMDDEPFTEAEVDGALCDLFEGAVSVGKAFPHLHQGSFLPDAKVRMDRPVISFDTETAVSEKDPLRITIHHPDARVICLSISVFKWLDEKEGGCLIPYSLVLPERALTPRVLVIIFGSAGMAWAHNKNYDEQALWARLGFSPKDYVQVLCSMGALYVINQNVIPTQMGGTGVGLKPNAVRMFGIDDWEANLDPLKNDAIAELNAKTKEVKNWNKKGLIQLPLPRPFTYLNFPFGPLALYCGHDTGNCLAVAYRAAKTISEIDKKERNAGLSLSEYFYKIYSPTLDDLLDIERMGIPVNAQRLHETKLYYTQQIERLSAIFNALPEVKEAMARLGKEGETINVKSPDHASSLVEVMECEDLSYKTESGKWCCDKKVLLKLRGATEDIAPEHDFMTRSQKIWNFFYHIRRYRDLISKNIEALLPYILPDGTVKPSFVTAKMESHSKGEEGGTKTSRVTTKHPSTNTLIKDEDFLKCLDAPPGMCLVKWDWKSIEPMAHALLARCAPWIEIFKWARRDPKDPRADLYRQVFGPVIGVQPEEVTKKQRDLAKVFLLAMLYDRHPVSVAEALKIDLAKAYELCNNFFDQHPELAVRSNTIKIEFLSGNPIRNVFGQRAFYPMAKLGGYPRDILSSLTSYLEFPLYHWSDQAKKGIGSFRHIHWKDLEDCRKVGNWEIQSWGWTLTSTMIRALNNHVRKYGGEGSGLNETVHDAYRAILPISCAEECINTSFDLLYDLAQGRLGPILQHSNNAKHFLKRMGISSLAEIPVVTEAVVGPNQGEMKEHHPGAKLWMK